jgi:hypothetical protein
MTVFVTLIDGTKIEGVTVPKSDTTDHILAEGIIEAAIGKEYICVGCTSPTRHTKEVICRMYIPKDKILHITVVE